MNIISILNKIFKPSRIQALAHKETAFSVGSGLITQAPLMILLTWFMREVLDVTSYLTLSITNISVMTVISYIRVYYTRMYFSGRYDDILERNSDEMVGLEEADL